ncbi:Rha family transcriptional regulator, partial [Apilactobacillus micheneri]
MVLKNIEPKLVENKNNQVVTTSLQVAETFGKKNKTVLRNIESIINEKGVAQNCADPMFMEGTYKHPQNHQTYRMYYMNKDGFTLLAMGFTGKKAMQFKMEYINAFNAMQYKLKSVNQDSYMIDDPVKRAEKWIAEQNERKQLEADNKKLKPKAKYYDHQLSLDDGIKTSVIAQNYSMSAVKFNRLLHNLGVQYKVGKNWLLYKKYQNHGYIIQREFNYTEDKIATTMLWTPKGKKFIYNLLKDNGIVPENEDV